MAKKDDSGSEVLIVMLLQELPELLADYEHLAPDSDGNIDTHRQRRIKRVGTLLRKIQKIRKSEAEALIRKLKKAMGLK
jgi:hypothetical protein